MEARKQTESKITTKSVYSHDKPQTHKEKEPADQHHELESSTVPYVHRAFSELSIKPCVSLVFSESTSSCKLSRAASIASAVLPNTVIADRSMLRPRIYCGYETIDWMQILTINSKYLILIITSATWGDTYDA